MRFTSKELEHLVPVLYSKATEMRNSKNPEEVRESVFIMNLYYKALKMKDRKPSETHNVIEVKMTVLGPCENIVVYDKSYSYCVTRQRELQSKTKYLKYIIRPCLKIK